MANTFSQIYIQMVFAVKGRQSLIQKPWKDELYKYMTGVFRNKGQKLLAINGMPDHVHIFIGQKPNVTTSSLVKDVKVASSRFINEKRWVRGKFAWQEGYGAFSYGRSQLDTVIRYIQNQELHHKKWTFREEYIGLLKKFEIEYDEKYLFDWLED
ncbi:MAG: IS200/IS605 family transposase [Chitinophagales bacterium]